MGESKIIALSQDKDPAVYIVMGVDEHENDRVLQVFYHFDDAKAYCNNAIRDDFPYYDLWIDHHFIG